MSTIFASSAILVSEVSITIGGDFFLLPLTVPSDPLVLSELLQAIFLIAYIV